MAQIFRGRVRDTSTTTGTGSIAVSGTAIATYRTFSAVMATNDTIWAAIVNRTANEWEVGLYTYSALNTLARVAANVFDGSAGIGTLVGFSAGTKDVFGITPISTTAAKISIGDTPPATPVVGQLFWESDSGNLFIYYNDGTSSQWVPATIGNPGPPGVWTQITQAAYDALSPPNPSTLYIIVG